MRIKIMHVHRIKVRLASGETRFYYYHRRTRERLPDDPTSPAFAIKVAELNATRPSHNNPEAGTLAALIVAYRQSPEFRELAPRSKHDYGRYLDALREMWGGFAVADFKRQHVLKLRDTFADRPRTANYFVQIFRLLMSFAVQRGLRQENPALRPRMLRTGPGHRIWSEAAIATFKEHAPREMVTAMILGVYTGQRESDILRLPWSTIKNGVIEMIRDSESGDLSQAKTSTELWIPLHRDLQAYLSSLEKKATLIVVDEKGLPFKVDRFRHRFHDAVVACGLDGLTFHGLRKKATEMLAEAGCTDREIMAITGHQTHAMVSRYLDRSGRKQRARAAIRKLERQGRS